VWVGARLTDGVVTGVEGWDLRPLFVSLKALEDELLNVHHGRRSPERGHKESRPREEEGEARRRMEEDEGASDDDNDEDAEMRTQTMTTAMEDHTNQSTKHG
jgi:hypothetical protein